MECLLSAFTNAALGALQVALLSITKVSHVAHQNTSFCLIYLIQSLQNTKCIALIVPQSKCCTSFIIEV